MGRVSEMCHSARATESVINDDTQSNDFEDSFGEFQQSIECNANIKHNMQAMTGQEMYKS